jgi:adenylate cyclase
MHAGAYLTALGGVSATALYFDMSAGEYVRLLLSACLVIWVPDALVSTRVMRRITQPVVDWLAERGDAEGAADAWRAAAGLPLALLRQPALYAGVAVAALAWDFYASWELDLAAYSALIIFPGSFLVYAYWVALRFFGTEWILRPVLEDVARSLPDDSEPEAPKIRLRWRLTAALPAISVITGAVVGGFGAEEGSEVTGLALGMLAAVAVSVTISIWLIALLSESIVTPIGELREATRRVGAGDLTTRVPVISVDETGELARSFNRMVAGLEQRERLRDAFGTFVDPHLTERVLQEGTDLAGEDVEVSLLFMDIRGFTTYSESAEAREVVALLNDLYGEVVPVILRHRGHANKFIGDGLLAVFGGPGPRRGPRRPGGGGRTRNRANGARALPRRASGGDRDQHRAGRGRHYRRWGTARLHRDRRRGEHRGARRVGHAANGRRRPDHLGHPRCALHRRWCVGGAPTGRAQGQGPGGAAVRGDSHSRGRESRGGLAMAVAEGIPRQLTRGRRR